MLSGEGFLKRAEASETGFLGPSEKCDQAEISWRILDRLTAESGCGVKQKVLKSSKTPSQLFSRSCEDSVSAGDSWVTVAVTVPTRRKRLTASSRNPEPSSFHPFVLLFDRSRYHDFTPG